MYISESDNNSKSLKTSRNLIRIGIVFISITLLASCISTGTINKTKYLSDQEVLTTSADVRYILRDRPRNMSLGHVLEPNFITCAEPSPDIGKVISSSLSEALSASVHLPNGIDPKIAAAVSQQQATAIAQLTERLTTVQLLRDALYRACEAYANGAMSSTSYAVILSRFDDSMITLLQSELAAGAYGRSLATLSGEASGKSSSSLDSDSFSKEAKEAITELSQSLKENSDVESSLKQARKQNDELQNELDKTREEIGRIKEAISSGGSSDNSQTASLKENLKSAETKKSNLETSFEQSSKLVKSLESTLTNNTKNKHELEKKLVEKLTAAAEGSAKTSATSAGSIIPGQQKIEIAKVLHEMQGEYLHNLNADALQVACIMALDKPNNEQLTALGKYCVEKDLLNKGVEILRDIANKRFKLREIKLLQQAEPSAQTNSRSITYFDKNNSRDVMKLQKRLNALIKPSIAEDGIFGTNTSVAIRRFQAMSGLIADGLPNQETLRRLGM